MKVLQINCVYANGSTGKIVEDAHKYYLSNGIDSVVVYGRGQGESDENLYRVSSEYIAKFRNLLSRATGNIYGYGRADTKKICSIIKEEKPDIVHLHCINGFFCDIYSLLEFLKSNNIATVLTMHAEFMYTGNCAYAYDCEQWKKGCKNCPDLKQAINSINKKAPEKNWQKMYNAFSGFENLIVTGVSDWISERAKCSDILKGKSIFTVLNGLNTEAFNLNKETPEVIEELRRKNKKIILYVTPYFEDENKGGKWVLELAKRLKNENIQFVVAGSKTEEYNIDNITFLGRIESAEQLACYYAASDICLLTSKRETFSMVTAESLCCGTPIVGFEAGAPEMIALKDYSAFVPYGDLDALEAAVKEWLAKDADKKEISLAACKKYSKQAMAEGYINIYKKLLEK